MKLSQRLEAVHSMLLPCKRIADIGTDHGYIPVQACISRICEAAIAADVVAGPLQAAQDHIAQANLSGRIECRLGDGLSCLRPGEVNGAVICGMGGPLIRKILAAAPDVVAGLQYVLLQPMNGTAGVRKYIYSIGWHIDDEQLIWEDRHLYEIIRAVPGWEAAPPEWLYDIGPVNWQKRPPLLAQLFDHVLAKYKKIENGQRSSRHPDTDRLALLHRQIQELEEKAWQFNYEKSSN